MDVFHMFFVIITVANNMLKIPTLENIVPNFFITKTFKRGNNMR